MSRIYKAGEAAKPLVVSRPTMQRWERENTLVAQPFVANRRYYTQDRLARIRDLRPHPKN
ncbi:MerR family transcriptional regulator, partial [Lactobacillus crispatus]|uniref:MerR family transcriptional regulator n=1 Tax=Lactobacillus crispatus TaxID=47770 RepID=UPI0012D9A3A7